VDDKLILYGFVAGFALNAVLAAQMIYYWNAPSAKAKGKQKEVAFDPTSPATSTSTSTAAKKGPTTRRRG
jgi:mannose-P-dolichol utilization defect protein 1